MNSDTQFHSLTDNRSVQTTQHSVTFICTSLNARRKVFKQKFVYLNYVNILRYMEMFNTVNRVWENR
jgi:hypothetical protein